MLSTLTVSANQVQPRVLIFNRGNRVACKVNLGRHGYSYREGKGRSISRNKGADMNKYPYLVSIDYLEDFLILNGIANTVVIDPASIDTFYGFSGHYFVKPTKKWVDMWWNYDCPDLYRYTTNKDRSKNIFGFNPFYWQNCLVNVCVSGAYIDRDITAEEVFAFGRGREHTDVVREMQAVLEGRQLAENEAKIKELTAIVQGYEAKIQAVIDKHTDEILQHMCDKGVLIRGNDGILKEKFFGLDCGFCATSFPITR